MASSHVTIRIGIGTDAAMAAPARRRLSYRLAAQARDHLIQHGVSADSIGTGIDLTAAGAGATGNKTSQGRRPSASVFLDIATEASDIVHQQPQGDAK